MIDFRYLAFILLGRLALNVLWFALVALGGYVLVVFARYLLGG